MSTVVRVRGLPCGDKNVKFELVPRAGEVLTLDGTYYMVKQIEHGLCSLGAVVDELSGLYLHMVSIYVEEHDMHIVEEHNMHISVKD